MDSRFKPGDIVTKIKRLDVNYQCLILAANKDNYYRYISLGYFFESGIVRVRDYNFSDVGWRKIDKT